MASRPPTDDDLDWLKYYREAKRTGFANANAAGQALLTTSTTLAGAYVALLSALKLTDNIPTGESYFGLLLPLVPFWLAMVAAALSIIPQVGRAQPTSPTEIAQFHHRAMTLKFLALIIVVLLLILGSGLTVTTVTGLPVPTPTVTPGHAATPTR